jgi:hypothetical protein
MEERAGVRRRVFIQNSPLLVLSPFVPHGERK